MEKIEEKVNPYTLNLDDELFSDARQHLVSLVTNRVDHVDPKLIGSHVYSLRIFKTPTRKDYHQFDLSDLQEISRKLTNGLSSLGSITNRDFWNKYFKGGVRFVFVQSDEFNEFPTFVIDYILFSEFDNLDVRLIKNLNTRVRIIEKNLTIKFDYVGTRDTVDFKQFIPEFTEMVFEPSIEQKLGFTLINQILDLEFQRPRFFGRLFKTNTKEIDYQ